MATLLHGDSRRMYSWWWDSHISPKNSKWLQENLTDMDRNVKTMIKLIEEDADSFARRAEMYYKKRPELMKLVEEFYRAYRALAERYDHATGALRQAHRTMAEAFPNQIPPVLLDESPPSSGSEMGPHTPEMPSPMRAPLDSGDIQKDALGVSSHFHVRRRNGAFSEESDLLSRKKGLKQLKEMFSSGEELTRAKCSEGKVRKVLNFKEEEGRVEEKEDLKNEIRRLQEEVSQLSTMNVNLMNQMASESQRAQTLEETIFKLESMEEAARLQYKLSIERISSLETDISNTRHELNKVNDRMVLKLNGVEEQCLAMEKVNKSLQLELETQQKELEKRGRELEELNTSIEVEHQKRMQAELALMSLEQIHSHSQEEAELLVLEVQHSTEKLKDMEMSKVGLEDEISELKEIIDNLHEQNIAFDLKIKDLKDEIKLLKETKEKLEYEMGSYLEENNALQKELCYLKEDQKDLEQRHRSLTEQMEVVSEKNVVLENSLSDANAELEGLRAKANALDASCETLLGEVSTHVVEKGVLVSQIEIISQKMEKLSEKNTLLEKSLSDANAEHESLRERFKDLEECCMSLCDQNSTLLADKNTLVSLVENLESKHLELQALHSDLEKEKDSTVNQVMELQSSLTVEKQEHESLISSLSSQLSSLHNHVHFLEEEFQAKVEDFEMEQQKVISSLFENFILQRCLCEMNGKNSFLFGECQNLLQASRFAENQISQLKHKELIQKKEITSLLEHNEVLNKGIILLLEALSIDVKHRSLNDIRDEVPQIILGEIKTLQSSILDTRVENQQLHLEVVNLERKYVTLQEEHANLEREKNSTSHQVTELERSLRQEKQEHETLSLSFSNQLAFLQNQIHLLQEEIRVRDEDFEVEQQIAIKAHLENFVLQRCLCDMKDKNLILSGECQNLLEAVRCAEKQTSLLEHKDLIQKKELTLLSNQSEILRSRLQLFLEALNIGINNGTMDDPTDQVLSQSILSEISNLVSSVSDACDENQCLHLEILVLVTLFKQIGLDKFHLHHELESQTKELLALASEKHKLMEMNKQLKDEKNNLVSQVEIIKHSLEMLQTKYSELEDKNLNLERQKDTAFYQVLELESSLKLEKTKHHAIVLSSKSHLASLEAQLDLLQEERQVKEVEFEIEQQKAMSVFLEIFILQRCLYDMKDQNLILSGECQKLLEASRCSGELISELEHERLIQQKEMMLISDNNEKLRSRILLLCKELDISKECETIDGTKDEVLLQTLLGEIKTMLNSVSNAKDERQCLLLEISVLVTLLKQIVLEKVHIYNELASRNEELLSVQNKKDEAMEINEQLKAEMQILGEQVLDLRMSHQRSETEICNLLNSVSNGQEERQCLLLEISVLVTLLKQIGLEKVHIYHELASQNEELLSVQNRKDEAMEINEQLKAEMQILGEELLNLRVSHQRSETEICNLLNSVSNAQEERQCLYLEISVLVTLLKQIGLEKVHLYHVLASRNEESLSVQNKKDEAMEINEKLKAEVQILREQLSDLHVSHERSKTEICHLLEENHSLSKRFFDLKEKMDALEGENSDVLAESLTLDHHFFFFKALSTERGLKLKLLSDDICRILAVKNGLDEEIRVQNERMREVEVETMNLKQSAILQEFDLNMARNFYEEFNLQTEAAENLLIQKEMELSEAREENKELYRKLEGVNKDLDGAKVMIPALEKEIKTLSSGIVSKDEEITDLLETNRVLQKELDRLNCDVEVHRRREEYLSSELKKGTSQVYKCEGEIQTLLNDIQISTINAAIFEEKVFELIVACESIQVFFMLQREMLCEDIALKNACVDEVKRKLEVLEGENGTLKADLNGYLPLLMSLFDGVACVEENIFSLAELQERKDDDTLDTPDNNKRCHQPSENERTTSKAGILDLQKLITKIEALQRVIIDTKNLLEQERMDYNAKIEAARKEIEELKLKEILLQEISKDKYGQTMKDIQLDQVSSSCINPYRANKNEKAESDDQMLELWETAERDDIEAVEEVKSEYPSCELIAQKELSIDKLEVSTRVNESSPREWNKRSIEKLDSDAQRLSVVQRSLQELKTKLESSEKKKHPKTQEYGTLKVQLREAEEAILEQNDINGKLKKKVEDNFESSNAVIWEKERRLVLEQARRGSEKIGKLELELQKIEYIFLKAEEEQEHKKTGCGDRTPSILLGEYIYGKRDGKGKRKGPFCRCMRPKTKD